ncbi:MAG: hypothetical protein PHE83_15580 [Opitutaceae bacterium]|nr:hypothetical protein [Opitutaceae bacterium]
MRRHLSVACLLAAWLCATGALLDVAQMVAWTRMFTGYVRTLPVAQALSRTFDPEKPCALCLAVQKARETGRRQQSPPTVAAGQKVVLISQPAESLAPAAIPVAWLESDQMSTSSWSPPVPVPPPRIRFASWLG